MDEEDPLAASTSRHIPCTNLYDPDGMLQMQIRQLMSIASDCTQFSRPGADISKKSHKERQRRLGFVGTSLVAVET